MPQIDFEKLLQESVDESLSSLGDSAKHAIYYHVESIFGIKREQIPNNVEAFAKALEEIFGQGAGFLETLITKRLHEKAGLGSKRYSPENSKFSEYIKMAKRSCLEKSVRVKVEKGVQQGKLR